MRFGWAYVNSLVTGAVAGGPTNSVQYNSGSQVLSGSSNFTFNPTTNTLVVTGTISASVYQGITVTSTPAGSDKQIQYNSGSTLGASSNLTFDYTTNTLSLTGTLRADNLIVSSSQILKSGSTIFGDDVSDTHQFTGSILGGIVSGTIARFTTITGSIITGSTALFTSITGNLLGTASNATLAATASYYNTSSLLITASVSNATLTFTKGDGSTFNTTINNVINALTASNADLFDNRDSTTFAGTGSNTFNGNQIITGTLNISSTLSGSTGLFGVVTSSAFSGGSYVGTTISGTTAQFTTVTGSTITGSTGLLTTITASQGFVSGGLTVGNYIQMLPVANVIIPTNQTASYIYTSGSTNDMYFTQYQPGTNFTNTTRLRWLEGMLTTGLLHGGVLSTVTGSTTFSLTSGSGIILSYNASTGSDPYPTVNYLSWPAYVSQSLTYVTSSLITYIGINPTGGIIQQTSPFTLSTDSDYITIGRVLHQSGSVTNGVSTQPIVSYGTNHWQDDFTRAFGPLKVSGHILAASGSTLGITKTAGDSYVIGRNYTNNPNNPNNISSANDTAVTVSKIYRAYVSGSTLRLDTGVNNAGYTTIDPAQYNNNGTLASVGASEASIQRVYWYPNTVSRAFTVYYGSAVYADPPGGTNALDVAQQNIASENFVEGENTAGAAILVGYILALGNATNLSNTAQARFIQAGVSRGAGAGGGGGVAVGATNAAGLDTYVQFNDGGSTFGGDAGLIYNKTTDTLSGVVAQFTQLTTSNITASSQLQVGSNASIGGNILGSGALKAGYLTYTGSFTVPTSAYFVGMSTTGSALTASLDSATTYPAGQTLIFKDIGGNAGTNNIRITPSGSQTIDNATSLVISNTSGSAIIISNGVDGFYIVGLT